MATKIYELVTKIFLLVAGWLPNQKVYFEPCWNRSRLDKLDSISKLVFWNLKEEQSSNRKGIFCKQTETHKPLSSLISNEHNNYFKQVKWVDEQF